MPKIVITEIDATTPGPNSESFEVVYIPGCVDVSQDLLYNKEGEYVGLEKNKPTLFTSVAAFEALCGTQGLTFTEDKDYRTLISQDSTGFAADAVPYDSIIFKSGDIDPAYIMAKELLAAGLNVLYERVNNDYTLKASTKDPEDWSTNYNDYFATMNKVIRIPDAVPPVLGLFGTPAVVSEVLESYDAEPIVNKTYYTRNVDSNGKLIDTYSAFVGTDFAANTQYYVQGRTFYTLSGEDGTTLDWAIAEQKFNNEVGYYLHETFTVYPLATIPDNWATTYWKDYYTLIEVTENVPGVISGTQVVAPDLASFKANKTIYTAHRGIDLVNIYTALEGVYDAGAQEGLADKGNFSIKYLTSGGYPVYEYNDNSVVAKMKTLAETRGDCVAIIDHTDNLYRESNVALAGSLYKTVSEDVSLQEGGEYATMFTPWATYVRTTTDKDSEGVALKSKAFRMPASFAYLTSLADSIQTNASWLAVAGATRGIVGNLASGGMTTDIPNGAADTMQPRQGIAINAITNIKPYGYTIWGNRTLKKNAENLTATSFLNIRNLVSDVKKTCYRAARALTFEQNTEVLWVNFKSKIAPTLDRMLSGYGISGYKIVRDTEHEKAAEKATICAKVILYPVYAVEDFYITIVLKDDEISVESAE